MKSNTKQEALDKQRLIALETLEYLIVNYTGLFVVDDYDSTKEYYVHEKSQVEKYYKERRLNRITAKLEHFIRYLSFKKDIMYSRYIEEKTGHRIDLYPELRARINKIVHNGNISSIEEFADVEFMIRICKNAPDSSFDEVLLQSMLDDYQEANVFQTEILKTYGQEAVLFKIIDSREVSDMDLTKFMDQSNVAPEPEPGLIYKVNSPNSRNWIKLFTSGKDPFALTYLVAGVDGGSGTVYCAKGKNLKIRADWEDDTTIKIEAPEEYETTERCQKIATRTSTINIKYSQ